MYSRCSLCGCRLHVDVMRFHGIMELCKSCYDKMKLREETIRREKEELKKRRGK